MALIIEDGTIVANANSYITLADARTFLVLFGQTLPAVDADAEAALVSAFYYVNSYENQYQGVRSNSAQVGSFPRKGVYINSFLNTDTTIPVDLINAQCFAAYQEGLTAGSLSSAKTGKATIAKEVTGAVKVQYADNGAIDGNVSYSRVSDALSPLLNSNSSSFQINCFRG
jgi:hypothetical protein